MIGIPLAVGGGGVWFVRVFVHNLSLLGGWGGRGELADSPAFRRTSSGIVPPFYLPAKGVDRRRGQVTDDEVVCDIQDGVQH